jgi:hypothetical protein
MAAVLAGGHDAALSHRSAAALWGILATARRDIEITVARECEALRLGSPTSLQALLARYARRPGTPAIRRLLDEGRIHPTATRSELERRFLSLLEAENLPRPLVNEPILLSPHTNAEPDLRWPQHRLVVELDGYETHGTRQAFERDRALQIQGWRVLHITWRQLHDDGPTIAAELRALSDVAAPRPRKRSTHA